MASPITNPKSLQPPTTIHQPLFHLMAYNAILADRTRELIAVTDKKTEEKAMFGGLCFMVDDKMCIGVEKDRLMVRLDPDIYDEVMQKPGCQPMNFTGKIMKGYVYVDEEEIKTKKQLAYWVQLALDFNSKAKASKKNKPKK
jgi:TfoX/Sxy family transcriptional regulator of competence genes